MRSCEVLDLAAADPRAAAQHVVWRLEAAGATLLALPGSGFSPRMSAGSVDVVHNAMEAYGWSDLQVRAPVPAARAIDEMDQAMIWLRYIPNDRYVLRRIVGARMLVHPVTERHLFSWRRIGGVLGCHRDSVQLWHGQAIDLIVAKLHERNYFQ